MHNALRGALSHHVRRVFFFARDFRNFACVTWRKRNPCEMHYERWCLRWCLLDASKFAAGYPTFAKITKSCIAHFLLEFLLHIFCWKNTKVLLINHHHMIMSPRFQRCPNSACLTALILPARLRNTYSLSKNHMTIISRQQKCMQYSVAFVKPVEKACVTEPIRYANYNWWYLHYFVALKYNGAKEKNRILNLVTLQC